MALVLMGGGISISLLFWAKLRVVTNIPRTTYADPVADATRKSDVQEPPAAPTQSDDEQGDKADARARSDAQRLMGD